MHHKRKRSKRSVRCSMCTKYRWMGNTKGRVRISARRKMQSED